MRVSSILGKSPIIWRLTLWPSKLFKSLSELTLEDLEQDLQLFSYFCYLFKLVICPLAQRCQSASYATWARKLERTLGSIWWTVSMWRGPTDSNFCLLNLPYYHTQSCYRVINRFICLLTLPLLSNWKLSNWKLLEVTFLSSLSVWKLLLVIIILVSYILFCNSTHFFSVFWYSFSYAILFF